MDKLLKLDLHLYQILIDLIYNHLCHNNSDYVKINIYISYKIIIKLYIII